MKFVQLKEFRSEEISQEMAKEIFEVAGMDGALIKGSATPLFIVDNVYAYWHYDQNGVKKGISNSPGNNGGYTEIKGVNSVIIMLVGDRSKRVHVDVNGRAITYIYHKKGEIKRYDIRNGIEYPVYYDVDSVVHMYPCAPDQLMEIYMKYGFYSVDIVERLKEMYPTIHYIIDEKNG